jgi:dTDP-4-dehydrorhamnose reductase
MPTLKKKTTRILILGATGMLGHTLFQHLGKDKSLQVFGTARQKMAKICFPPDLAKNLLIGVDANQPKTIANAIKKVRPDVVINCIGLIKQLGQSNDVMQAIPINTLLPHQLAQWTKEIGARLILMSTDCVFSGKAGNYTESNIPDCTDLYGQSKLLGEISDQAHVLTLRTSIIGHELRGGHSLVDWFLSQKKQAAGYTQAIYSGLPTIEMAHILKKWVIPNSKLSGLYHLSTEPISKFDLLSLIANIYGKKISLKKSRIPKIDRSLNCKQFTRNTGYIPKDWPTLIEMMHADYLDHQADIAASKAKMKLAHKRSTTK